MKAAVSLRWRLILLSGSLATGSALVLTAALHARNERQLLEQVDRVLETKCDEVVTVLAGAATLSTLEQFLRIETTSRSSARSYFYELRDVEGHPMTRSPNLGDRELPWPESWTSGDLARAVQIATVPDPMFPAGGRIRLRSERVDVAVAGLASPSTLVIQSAASLGSFDGAVRRSRRESFTLAGAALAVVFGLLWLATTRSLLPVTVLTRSACWITEAGWLQERLPRTGRHDEIDRLAAALNDMLDRLAASVRQMERFSSDVAHQLRTPLTRIRGALDLVLRTDLPDEARSQISKAQEDVDGLARVCAQMLLLARLDRQERAASLLNDTVVLADLVAELVEQAEPAAREKDVSLICTLTAPVRVRGSRPLLAQAAFNLLDNALRATPPGGVITVSIDVHGSSARLSICDSGPGIPPEERDRIFEPFHRAGRQQAGPNDDGSGLGLAIVRSVVQAHGGRVELRDAPAGGSDFRMVLPLAAPPPHGDLT